MGQLAGLLATIGDSKPAGYLYAAGESFFSGPAEPQYFKFDFQQSTDEPFNGIFVDDGLTDFNLTITQDGGQINKKTTRQAVIEFRKEIDLPGTLAIIVDVEGNPCFIL